MTSAAVAGNAPFARLLLANGAEVNLRDANGATAYAFACDSTFPSPEVCAIIKEAGGVH